MPDHAMTNLMTTTLLTIGLMAASAHPAEAQQRWSVELGALAGQDHRDSSFNQNIVGAAIGALITLTPRWSLGFELDTPRARHSNNMSTFRLSSGVVETSTSYETFRPVFTSIIGRRHFRAGSRVDIAVVGGVGLEHRLQDRTGVVTRVFPDGSTTRHEGSSSSNYTWTSAPLGIDASIVLTPHLAVVPQLRFRFEPLWFLNDGCCGGSQSAGRLTLRWKF